MGEVWRDYFDLTRDLIDANGIDGAIQIARENGWYGVLSQCLALRPALLDPASLEGDEKIAV